MKIAVDLDDVTLDFVGGLLSTIEKEYAVYIDPEEVTDWNLRPLLDPIVGQNWWSWLRERGWLWSTFPAVRGAIGSLEILRREGHYLVCITSKPRWAEYNTWQWLGKWRPPFQQVIIIDKDDVKADFTDADLLIDDKIENCAMFAASGRLAFLFDRPYNRDAQLPPGVSRVYGWPDALASVKEIAP